MSQNLDAGDLGRPLSVGDVVSAGMRIYRSHLKQYFNLAMRATFWGLVPVYGWAKSPALLAVISRLSFGELVNQPETETTAQNQVELKLWNFLVISLLLGLIFAGIYSLVWPILIVFGILGGILGAIFPPAIFIVALLGIVAFFAFVIGAIRIYSRLFLADLPLAIEPTTDPIESMKRSWNLTEGHVDRIQWIVLLAFLVTLVVQLPVQIVAQLLQTILARFFDPESAPFLLLLLAFTAPLGILSNMLVAPFWQTVKAVLYYDLRVRREGLGLKLRDRDSPI